MFESLGNHFNSIIQKFKFQNGKVNENDLNQTLQSIRIALLDSDVNIKVALKITQKIKEDALGYKIVPGVTPAEMIIKLSNDAIVEILGGENEHGYKIDKEKNERIMLVGLQGAGKTTTAAKLANFIKMQTKVSPLLSSLDYYRPAAREQLKILSQKNNLDYYDYDSNELNQHQAVLDTTRKQLEFLEKNHHEAVIFDTAGRTSINADMMDELVELKNLIKPTKIILVIDSMIGRTAIEIARHFHESLHLTGLIFTKTDSDAKAGAILSIRHGLNIPINFLCSGEKINDLDEFHADRIAQRILGMGDIVSLVEKASSVIPNDNSEALKAKAAKGKLDLFDVLDQFRFLKKMGGLPFISKFLPAEMLNNANISDKKIKHFEAIILSMTHKERIEPSIVSYSTSRKKRISMGSGTNISLIEELIAMHSKISKMAQQFASFDKNSMMDKFKMGDMLNKIGKN